MKARIPLIIISLIVVVGTFFVFTRDKQFDLPTGDAVLIEDIQLAVEEIKDEEAKGGVLLEEQSNKISTVVDKEPFVLKSSRQIFETDGVKHSIPIDEIK